MSTQGGSASLHPPPGGEALLEPPSGSGKRRGPGRRALALGALGALGAPALARPAPVALLVGAAAGSAADAWARGFAPFLERHWPHSAVTVANHPGEGGLAALRRLAAAPPDGRVIGAVAVPQLLARAIEAGAEALPERVRFLAVVAEEPLVLVAPAGGPEDLAALRAMGPGLTLGTPPPGSAAQLVGHALARALALLPLAFPSAPAARQAVLTGGIPCALLPLPAAVAALRDGRLAGLATAGAERSPLLPAVPSLAERGLPAAPAAQRGFALPSGGDPGQVQPLLAALQAAVADPEFADQAESQGYEARFIGPASWQPMLRGMAASLAERWQREPWTARRE